MWHAASHASVTVIIAIIGSFLIGVFLSFCVVCRDLSIALSLNIAFTVEGIRVDSPRALDFFSSSRIHFRFFYFLYLMGPSGGHLLRCVGPIPPAGVLLDSSSPVSEGALCLSEVG